MLSKSELQRLRDLRERKHREAESRFVVEGAKAIADLLAEGYPFESVYHTDAWSPPARLAAAGPRFVAVTELEMARASHLPTPSPVLAVGPILQAAWDIRLLDTGLTLALDRVQDPGNVGTLLRTADWFGAARVMLSPECADLYSQKVINASMGSFARVPVHVVPLAEALAGARVPVLGCDLGGDDVRRVPPVANAIVVIGSEGRGLSDAVRARLTRRVTIPRRGRAESLNAAVAAGIVLAALTAAP